MLKVDCLLSLKNMYKDLSPHSVRIRMKLQKGDRKHGINPHPRKYGLLFIVSCQSYLPFTVEHIHLQSDKILHRTLCCHKSHINWFQILSLVILSEDFIRFRDILENNENCKQCAIYEWALLIFSNTCCTLCIYWRIQCYFHHYVTALRGCVVNNYLNLLGHCGQCWDLRNVNIISLEVKRTYILVCSHQCHVSHIFKLSKYTWCIWLLSLCALNCCHYIKMYFSMYTNMQLSVCLVWWL